MARRWSTDEDRLLARLYAQGVAVEEIASRFGRSADAVVSRRRALGIMRRRAVRGWSRREDDLLRAATAARLPATVIAPRLGRPVEQVRNRRRILGLARAGYAPYAAEEDRAIREAWSASVDLVALATRLGRSPDAVRIRARELKLVRSASRARWQDSEDAAIRDGYDSGLTCAEMAKELSGRTAEAIAARARKLGLTTYGRHWTRREDEMLRRAAATMTIGQSTRWLGRTPEALRQRSRHLGITSPVADAAPSGGTRWTEDEDATLRLHAALNPARLAGLLGRSDGAVARRLSQLGLREGRTRSPHHPVSTNGRLSPAETRLLAREVHRRDGLGRERLARRLGREADDLDEQLPEHVTMRRMVGQ